MTDEKLSRRQLLQTAIVGLAAVPAAELFAGAAHAEMLSESDPTAKSLGYVADAKKVNAAANPNYKPGQNCANCMQYMVGKCFTGGNTKWGLYFSFSVSKLRADLEST